MRVQGVADSQVFMEVAAFRDAFDQGTKNFTWNPVALPNELLDDAFDTASAYADAYMEEAMPGGDDGKTFDLARAILGEDENGNDVVEGIVAQSANNKEILDRLIALELAIIDAIRGEAHGFMRPGIGFASLDEEVNGYFEPGRPGEPGRIVLSHDLKTRNPEFVDRVVLEELGEALADHLVTDLGVAPGEGDVGNRLMKTFLGQPFAEGDFEEKNSDKVWIRNNQYNASQDHDVEALAIEWGVTVERATEITAELDVTMYGPPFTADSYPVVVGWLNVIDAYGVANSGQLTLYELGAAMADGMVTTELAPPGLGEEGARVVNYVDHIGVVGETPPAETERAKEDEPALEGEVHSILTDEDIALAEEWGIADPYDVANGRQIANQIYTRLDFKSDEGFTGADSDAAGWNHMVRIYGISPEEPEGHITLHVDDLARAIADGVFKIAYDPTTHEPIFSSVDLMDVNNKALADATWNYAEGATHNGGERTQIPWDLLTEATVFLTGTTTEFTEADFASIQSNFADVPHSGEIPESGEGNLTRFSEEAVHAIWETGGFIRQASVEPANIEISVSDTPKDLAVDEALIVDGQWYSFGYYDDENNDTEPDGEEIGSSEPEFSPIDIPEAAEIPPNAEVISIQDFTEGQELFTTQAKNVRIISYNDVGTGEFVIKAVDMTEGSSTKNLSTAA